MVDKTMRKVTICGGGNVGHVLACELARNVGLSVKLLSSSSKRVDSWSRRDGRPAVTIIEGNSKRNGVLDEVTHDARSAVLGADLVILALPAHLVASALRRIAPYCSESMILGAIPGHGGFHWQVASTFEDVGFQPTIFGFDRSPWTCRIIDRGRSVLVLGRKDAVGVFVEPRQATNVIAQKLAPLFDAQLNPLPTALHAILGATNQFVHPAIYYGKLRNWDGKPFNDPPMAYENTDIATAAVIVEADRECARVREKLNRLDPTLTLSTIPSILQRLGGRPTSTKLETRAVAHILSTKQSLRGLELPCFETLTGWMPDFSSRFLTEDIPFGLCVIKSMAELLDIPTPWIDKLVSWGQKQMGKEYIVADQLRGRDVEDSGSVWNFGLRSRSKLIQ